MLLWDRRSDDVRQPAVGPTHWRRRRRRAQVEEMQRIRALSWLAMVVFRRVRNKRKDCRIKLNRPISAIFCVELPLPFGRICFVMLVMRKGRESSESGSWHLGCTLEIFHVHSYQEQFIQPGWAECLEPRFVFCVFICVSLICLCVPILLRFPGQFSHLRYSFWR